MRKPLAAALAATLAAGLGALVPAGAATAAPPADAPAPASAHDRPSPLSDKQRALRQKAVEQVARGEKTPQGGNRRVEVAKGQYVELAQEDGDAIWTVLGAFSDVPENTIPEPDRSVDDTTIWAPDFSREYFDELLYSSDEGVNSVANFYEEQSSGRYTVTGEVEDWVTLPGDGASYGGNTGGPSSDRDPWGFVGDTVDTWYAEQVQAGRTPAQIDAYLAQFDVWDRYDQDGDGDFDEADGYIDHFQAVHSGMGEEVGGGQLGPDAIWSHRWYVQSTRIGAGGPTLDDGTTVPNGGTRVGESKYWIGDYTVEPENGGVGVFAHEFAHDLGLPDLYDTSGNTGGAENSTGFWTLMSSGSYGNSGQAADGIGTTPMHMGAWEKLQLGWLDHETVPAGEKASIRLGPASTTTKQAQAALVELPDREVTTELGAPFEGADYLYSGAGDGLDHTATTALPADAAQLTAKVRYQIEQDWDYAYAGYVQGGRFVSLPTNLSTDSDPYGQNFGSGITGSSEGAWVDLTVDVSTVPDGAPVGFRYWTDGAVTEPGLSVDAVQVDGAPVGEFALDGFRTTTGTETESFFNAYLAELRTYRGYDDSLRTGPYNFGDPTRPDSAERFPYQDGLLISYWNTEQRDNSVGAHPGAGLVLPVDAHPGLLYEPTDDEGADRTNGESWRPRIQSYDATFGLEPTDEITLHDPDTGIAGTYGGLPAVSTFDDTQDWYVAPGEQPDANGWTGVDVPKTGTTITVRSTSAQGSFMQIQVN